MTAVSARFEFRLRPDVKDLIERAAALVNETTSDFARTATEERARRILQEHMIATVVPAAFFDGLLDALDAPPSPNAALSAAARRSRGVVERR